MEFTYQSTMQLPASYAVLSEDEMVYTVGGAFELNINAQDVLNFTVNVGVNLVRMLGQAAISNTIAGIIDMRNDGLTTMGAIEHYWGRQTPVGKTMTVPVLQAFMSTTGLGLPLRASCPSTTICGISTTRAKPKIRHRPQVQQLWPPE